MQLQDFFRVSQTSFFFNLNYRKKTNFNVSDVSVVSACGQFRCRDCRRLDLFLHCATQPVIESSQKIQTAPLIIDFESIENHLQNLNISKFTNHWNQVRNLDFSNFIFIFHFLRYTILVLSETNQTGAWQKV